MIRKKLFEEVLELSEKGILLEKRMIRKLVRNIVSNIDFITRKKFKYTYFRDFDNFCAKTNIEDHKICFSMKTCYEEVNEYNKASVLEKISI